MKLYELAFACWVYPAFGDFDKSLSEFRRKVGPDLDPFNAAHREALFVWLNAWGCRQFAKDYYAMAGRSLTAWAERFMDRLPRRGATLVELPDSALDLAAETYGNLMERRACLRTRKSKASCVTFGPTGAAKTLFALRPSALLPWDDPIREKLNFDGSADSYRRFLQRAQRQAQELSADAARFGLDLSRIRSVLGRPNSTICKLIDEYHRITMSKGCQPPSTDQLGMWTRWAGST